MNELQIRPIVEEEEYGVCVAVDAFVDDELLDNTGELAVSLYALRDSMEQSGEHYILTCGCGEPECAGLTAGIQVTHGSDVVEWRLGQPPPERRYVFDRLKYREAIEEGITRARQAFAEARANTSATKTVEAGPYGEDAMYLAG